MQKTIRPEFIRRFYTLMTPSRLIWILTILALPVSISLGETYRIEPGDTLSIVVLDHPAYGRNLQVRRDGHIIYFGGELHLAGKSLVDAADLIRDRITNYGRTQNPIVIIDPLHGRGFLVWGEVTVTNRFALPLHDKIGLYDALAKAGGMSGGADRENVKVIRADKRIEVYDLSPDQEYREILIEDGDIIFVSALASVQVNGQVLKPGRFLVREKIRIDHALVQAGGPVSGPDDVADLTSVVIVRKSGEIIELNLGEEFWKNPQVEEEGYYLRDGDTMYIPSAYKFNPVHVLGYVRNPGPYRIGKPISPREAISRAGGFEEFAKRGEVKVWRKDGTIEEIILDWEDDEDSAGSKTLLYPGDSLEVGKRFHIDWSFVLSVISIATTSTYIFLSK